MTFALRGNKVYKKNNTFRLYNSINNIDINVIRNHINNTFISKLTGKTAPADMFVYSSQDPYTNNGTFVRNPNCWLSGVTNISCFSPAQMSGANWWQRGGTLISPRHVLFAKHFTTSVLPGGTPLRFVDDNNNTITRNIVQYASDLTDISIAVLDSDVPSNIKFAKVLPPDYISYLKLSSQDLLYSVALDQQEKAIVKRMGGLSGLIANDGQGGTVNIPNILIYNLLESDPFFSFTETIIVGDSGNPVFLIIDNELVVLTTWWTANSGPFITTRYNTVNSLMNQLGGGYQLTPINLQAVYNKYR